MTALISARAAYDAAQSHPMLTAAEIAKLMKAAEAAYRAWLTAGGGCAVEGGLRRKYFAMAH